MDFTENGYAVLKGVLSDRELEPIRTVIAKEVDRRANELYAQGKISEKFEDHPFNTRWIELCKMHKQVAMGWNREVFSKEVYDLCTHPKLLNIIESIIGPEIRVNGDYWVRPKLPNERLTTLPWHQDGFYYHGKETGEESIKIISVWIPLVDVDEINGCLQVIPDSHKWGLISCVPDIAGHLVPTEDVEARGVVRSLQMQVGDIFIFDQLTMHRSLPNLSNEIRWSIDLRYSPADQSFAWHSDPDFERRYPCFIASSKSDPKRVERWEEWHGKHLVRI